MVNGGVGSLASQMGRNARRRRATFALGVFALVLASSQPAVAQWGEAWSGAPRGRNATSDFQGLLDTNSPAPGTVTVSLPSLQVDVGVTERWSLGLNGWVPLGGAAEGQAAVALRSRYRLYDSDRVSLTLDGHGLVRAGDGTFYGGMLHNNLSWRFASDLEFQGLVGVAASRLTGTGVDSSLLALATALGVAWHAAPWLTVQATVASFPAGSGTLETPGFAANFALSGTDFEDRLMFRLMVYLRAGDRWLFEVGAYSFPALWDDIAVPLPWLGVTGKLG